MILCPCPQQLLRFLDEDLEPDDQARILVHVEDAGACQYRLELLTRAQPLRRRGMDHRLGAGAVGSGSQIRHRRPNTMSRPNGSLA